MKLQLHLQMQLQPASAVGVANASEAGDAHEICVHFMSVCGICKVNKGYSKIKV